MADDRQTASEQSVMNKLAMALAVALVAGATGYGIGGVAGPGLLKPAEAPMRAAAPAPQPVAANPREAGGAPAPAKRLDGLMGQSVGTVCETPEGECLVGQAPISSYCQCGGSAGRIVR